MGAKKNSSLRHPSFKLRTEEEREREGKEKEKSPAKEFVGTLPTRYTKVLAFVRACEGISSVSFLRDLWSFSARLNHVDQKSLLMAAFLPEHETASSHSFLPRQGQPPTKAHIDGISHDLFRSFHNFFSTSWFYRRRLIQFSW